MITDYQRYFFIGIAGTGMSALAQYLCGQGKEVAGSDRLFNSDHKMELQQQFEQMGIKCYPQDCSGITGDQEAVIISTAIEATNPEYQKAQNLNLPIITRSSLLAAISENKKTIAIAGTSGKSTTAAMLFHIMQANGLSPSLIIGAGLVELQEQGFPGNAYVGNSDWLVIEADESDGSIVHYKPRISVLLNIEHDHKSLPELKELFSRFKSNTTGPFIVNDDDPEAKQLSVSVTQDFGGSPHVGFSGTAFQQQKAYISFNINDHPCIIPVIGYHNMENALASISAGYQAGIAIDQATQCLHTYKGIYRRTQIIGTKNGVMVIDDFAHNPSEVAAAIRACQQLGNRIFAWFQPHGFGPLRFMYRELAQNVAQTLRKTDTFLVSNVYYAGGSVNQDMQSDVIHHELLKYHQNSRYIPDRNQLMPQIQSVLRAGDIILLMGARDPSLSEFAKECMQQL